MLNYSFITPSASNCTVIDRMKPYNNIKYKNALHIACENENPKIVKQLLKYNVNNNNVNYKTVLQNALHISCELRNLKIIKMLINAGADISIIPNYLYNLYYKIIQEKKGYWFMKMLIKAGINMNECSTFINTNTNIQYSFRYRKFYHTYKDRDGRDICVVKKAIWQSARRTRYINKTVYHTELLTNGKLLKYILLNGNISCDYRDSLSDDDDDKNNDTQLIPLSPYELIFINKVECANSVIKKLIKYNVKCDIDIENLIELYNFKIMDNMDITNFKLIIMNNISCYKKNNMFTLINNIIDNIIYKDRISHFVKIKVSIDIVKIILNIMMY
jgi:hypothetical protein